MVKLTKCRLRTREIRRGEKFEGSAEYKAVEVRWRNFAQEGGHGCRNMAHIDTHSEQCKYKHKKGDRQ